MFFNHSQQQRFRWLFIPVFWVIIVCLAKNSGLPIGCSGVSLNEDIMITQSADTSEDCDLSEQLLSAHQHQVDTQALIMFVFALVFIAWLLSTPQQYLSFTEPIVQKQRVHLRLCVFRE